MSDSRSRGQKAYNALLGFFPYTTRQRIDYRRRAGRFPNLSDPELHSERLTSRMFETDRRELVRACSKLEMKQHASDVAEREGLQLVVPRTLRYFPESASSLSLKDLSGLHEPWVAKPNHLGGGLVLFSDDRGKTSVRSLAAFQESARSVESGFSRTAPLAWRMADRGVIVEERVGSGATALTDYKLHVFCGEVMAVSAYSGRRGTLSVSHFRPDGRELFRRGPSPPEFDSIRAVLPAAVPAAAALDLGLEYTRVDFYYVDDKLFFGEISPFGGMEGVQAHHDLDKELGDLWVTSPLPPTRCERRDLGA